MIQEYMLDKHFEGAFAKQLGVAAERILKKDPEEIAKNANVLYDKEKNIFTFKSLGEDVTVTLPDCNLTFTKTGQRPIYEWRIVVLHYLSIADGAPLGPDLIPYRSFQGGIAYNTGFEARSNEWLVKKLCNKPLEKIKNVCEMFGATFSKTSADICATFSYMPNYPITLQLWLTDEEMEGSGQVLFNSRAKHYLSAEDTDVAGSMLIDFLIYQYDLMFS